MLRLATSIAFLGLVLALASSPPAAAEGLADDGRAGVVMDRQGLVFARPAGRQRWTPLGQRDLVFPGDRLRTETRGANALELRLGGGARLTLGPGVLVDVLAGDRFEVLEGDVEAVATAARPLTLKSGSGETKVTATTVLRVKDGKGTTLPEPPKWLTGYRAGTSEEWMGSLVVTLDGKQVPLHVGWHKVDVEVLDQVARTTIEQTFVNNTAERLEGVFRFPLPAEASISGFGMWIGGELVEADVIERERARQIYEDILRRKKDPGLLEWAGGNVFQARVFPIEPHSEKRVRLRYTEVLPLEQGAWRYRYALQSELLRQKPLKELQVNVRVASTQALASVTCSTHAQATVSADAHTAVVELAQRDVSPTSDFEVVGRVKPGGGITVVSHRRDQDGWFMLLVQPPEPDAPPARTLTPDGKGLDLLLAVDTSGSIEPAARKAQQAFLGALLGQLGPDDKVRVATLDTHVRWMGQGAAGAAPDLGSKVDAFVDARPPRGWSDLDQGFEQILAQAGPGTQVVYVGDGIATRGDGDPVAFAQRIRAAAGRTQATWHAVAPGAAYEKGVLEALASLGGGSVRRLNEDPAGAAQRLLAEIAGPGLKDLEVKVEGVPTARVYPARLPNLPSGAQHVVLGRMDPSAAKGDAQVVVTGTAGGKPVRLTSAFTMPASGEGNSFLPRLWARRHLDALLEQGTSAQVKAEIVRFSIEHTILTPYTSLLVLESDEDRERYGVERRVKSRDGEVEFASARDQATLEASRRAMAAAQAWRLHLRNVMQREIARLGRDLPIPVPEVALGEWFAEAGPETIYFGEDRAKVLLAEASAQSGFGFTAFGRGGVRREWSGGDMGESMGYDNTPPPPSAAPASPMPTLAAAAPKPAGEPKSEDELQDDHNETNNDADEKGFDDADEEDGLTKGKKDARLQERSRRGAFAEDKALRLHLDDGGSAPSSGFGYLAGVWFEGTLRHREDVAWLGFPARGRTAWDRLPDPEPPVADEQARRLLTLLFAPGTVDARLKVAMSREDVHPLGGRRLALVESTWLRSAEDWFVQTRRPGGVTWERSLQGGVVTRVDTARRLARAWDAGPEATMRLDDLRTVLGLPTARNLEGAVVSVRPGSAGGVQLVIARPPNEAVTVWTLDPTTGDLLAIDHEVPGEPSSRTTLGGYVEVGGARWPTTITSTDAKGRTTSRMTLKPEGLDAAAYDQAFAAAHAGREDVVAFGPYEPTLREARASLTSGRVRFEDHIVLALDRLAADRHDEAWKQFDSARPPGRGKPVDDWLRAPMLAATRRGTELAKHLEEALVARVAAASHGRRELALDVLARARAHLAAPEVLRLLERLRGPMADADDPDAGWTWRQVEVQLLQQVGRVVEAREKIAHLAAERPYDLGARTAQANALAAQGEPEEAARYVDRVIDAGSWLPEERAVLETQRADLRRGRWRMAEVMQGLTAWTQSEDAPTDATVRRVTMLYVLGRAEEADAWVRTTLRTLGRGPTSTPGERNQLMAAMQLAVGQGWDLWSQAFTSVFVDDIVDAARFHLAQADARRGIAQWILQNWHVQQHAAVRALKKALQEEAAQPAAIASWTYGRLQAALTIQGWQESVVPGNVYEAAMTALEKRRVAAATHGERTAWATLLHGLAEQRGDEARRLATARAQREQAQGRDRIAATTTLFDLLVGLKHAPERETEAYVLLVELAGTPEPAARRLGRAGAELRSWVAWSLGGRSEALLGSPEARAKRSRVETREAERTARREARTGLAEVLAPVPAHDVLAPWVHLERGALLSENRVELATVAQTALAWLDGTSGKLQPLSPRHPLARVNEALRARAALLATHAATRRGAPPELATEVLAAFEARWVRPEHDWRYESFRLLVALDRVPELDRVLGLWAGPEDVEARWRRAQGLLAAELGRPADAAAAFEALRPMEGALAPGDFDLLATWYLVLGDTAKREAAVRSRFEHMGEWDLRNWVQAQRRAQGPGGVPGDLPPETWLALDALMTKAQWPQNHFWVVQNLYNATKDHRALTSLQRAVLGRSAGATYAILGQVGQAIDGVHEEATLDALRKAIETAASEKQTGVDARALALLLARVEVRASQVVHADGQHDRRALETLKRAGASPVAREEVLPFAQYLGSLLSSGAPGLAEERDRQLSALLAAADVPSGEHLQVALVQARVRWIDKRWTEALDGLSSAIDAALSSGDARAAAQVPPAAETRLGWLAERGLYAEAERLVLEARKRASSTLERETLAIRLAQLWAQGLEHGASFAIGRGAELYRAAQAWAEKEWQATPSQGPHFHGAHVATSAAARKAKVGVDVGGDRIRFAGQRLPALLAGWPSDVTDTLQNEAHALAENAGARPSLEFTLDRMDAEPAFYRRLGQDLFGQMEWVLVERRAQAEPLGALAPRLLARVKTLLTERILAEDHDVAGFWAEGNRYAWRAMWPELMAAALAAAEQRPDATGVQLAAAHHLRTMNRIGEAIAVLDSAEKRGHLDERGRQVLLDMLLQSNRFAPALEIADRLLVLKPENLTYHKRRARALVGLGRPGDAEAALRAGLEHASRGQTPGATLLGDVGSTAADMRLATAAVTWLKEALQRGEQSGEARGSWMSWRRSLALALAELGRTDEAVQVASVLAVGDRRPHRAEIADIDDEDMPEGVLWRAKDLPGYVSRFETEVARTGDDVPVIRKALARVFLKRGDRAQALRQLEVLRELVPDDLAVLRALVRLYDETNRPADALGVVDALVKHDPGNAGLWEDLGRRLARAGRSEDALRAFTSAIEMRPLEPDGHRLMARLAEEAKQPAQAAAHWHNVTRVRPLEPEGRLAEARAWIAAGEPAKARAPLDEVLAGTWEERFGDVKAQAASLLRR